MINLLNLLTLKKNAMWLQVNFIWGKMRTIARGPAFQIVLRNCSRGSGGRSESVHSIKHKQKLSASHKEQSSFQKEFSAFLNMRRHKNWVHKTGSWKILNSLQKTSYTSFFFFWHRVPHFYSPLSEGVETQQLQQPDLILAEADSRCRVAVAV